MLEHVIVQLRHFRGRIFHGSMFDSAGKDFGLGRAFLFPEEWLDNQINNVANWHEAGEPSQQPKGLRGVMQQFVDEKTAQSGPADIIDEFSVQTRRVNRRTFKVL